MGFFYNGRYGIYPRIRRMQIDKADAVNDFH